MNEIQSLYDMLGGEVGVHALVTRFYDLMDSAPEAKDIRALHANNLKQSREKLFLFLTGWSGGPQLYIEKHGHPRLRQRHMPFAIGSRERDQWLWCMNQAVDTGDFDPAVADHLKKRFSEIADFMRNKDETQGPLFQL
ncbi:MAG: group II truncated hemoglobin [Anaerolineales bacterium]|nr:group II truncated hemoglobin [Anaerolineales bacterium]